MAVKEGLPATDFSRMNREYIRNVAEGETVKDGLPATDFSRMNREYIKAVVEEAGGGITVEELNVTENDTYTAPEGKAYSPVIVNVSGGGGGSDLTTVKVTFVNQSASFAIAVSGAIQYESDTYPTTISSTDVNAGDTVVLTAIAYKGEADFDVATQNSNPLGNSITTSGDVTGNGYGQYYITGDCTFTMTDV